MEVIHGLDNAKREPYGAVTVGSFDGLHLGHQRILRMMRRSGLHPITVMTFEPHPQVILRSGQPPPPQLTSFDERAALFKKHGVDRLVVVRFTREFAVLNPEEFVRDVLVGAIGLKGIYIGPKHGFGAGRRGDAELLRKMGWDYSFKVVVVPPVERDGGPISSSRIRKCLLAGGTEPAMLFLGRPFYVDGVVIRGDRRGMSMGFPTANLSVSDRQKLTPRSGIYTTVTEVDGQRFPSVSHFGERLTFPGAAPAVETHLIGYDGDLYDRSIRVGLVTRLRDVAAFDSPGELVAQMERDRVKAKWELKRLGFGKDARLTGRRFGRISSQNNIEI
jgi:riboflavin kinase/FMN adenylyltransferase